MGNKLILRDIGKILSRSITRLDNDTLDKLRAARRIALQHQLTTKHSPATVWLNHFGLIQTGTHYPSGWFNKSHNLALALLLAMTLSGGVYYWHSSHEHDHSEIDVAILTDDLPVEMYVD